MALRLAVAVGPVNSGDKGSISGVRPNQLRTLFASAASSAPEPPCGTLAKVGLISATASAFRPSRMATVAMMMRLAVNRCQGKLSSQPPAMPNKKPRSRPAIPSPGPSMAKRVVFNIRKPIPATIMASVALRCATARAAKMAVNRPSRPRL